MEKRSLRFEALERRLVMDSAVAEAVNLFGDEEAEVQDAEVRYFPMIVAGESPDSPAARVTSDYPATGSLTMQGSTGNYLCSGTLIHDPLTIGAVQNEPEVTDNRWVLTAAHCLDTNNNGKVDFSASQVTFYPDGDLTDPLVAESLVVHPNFKGFGRRGSISDDIALIRLSAAPEVVSAHQLHEVSVTTSDANIAELKMVGFGRTGAGDSGYDGTPATPDVKREGGNHINDFGEGSNNSLNRDKIWRADFDHPTDDDYSFLGPVGPNQKLPNEVEATLGGGDSGGTSYIVGDAGGVVAINTFGYSVYNTELGRWIDPPYFGSGLGGILVHPYLQWINDVMTGGSSGGGGGGGDGGGGGGPKCHPKRGCSSTLAFSEQYVQSPDLVVTFAGALSGPGLSAELLAAVADSQQSEVNARETDIVPAQEEAWTMVSTDGRRSEADAPDSLRIRSRSMEVSDSLFDSWPTRRQSLFDEELLAF